VQQAEAERRQAEAAVRASAELGARATSSPRSRPSRRPGRPRTRGRPPRSAQWRQTPRACGGAAGRVGAEEAKAAVVCELKVPVEEAVRTRDEAVRCRRGICRAVPGGPRHVPGSDRRGTPRLSARLALGSTAGRRPGAGPGAAGPGESRCSLWAEALHRGRQGERAAAGGRTAYQGGPAGLLEAVRDLRAAWGGAVAHPEAAGEGQEGQRGRPPQQDAPLPAPFPTRPPPS